MNPILRIENQEMRENFSKAITYLRTKYTTVKILKNTIKLAKNNDYCAFSYKITKDSIILGDKATITITDAEDYLDMAIKIMIAYYMHRTIHTQ